MKKGSKHSEETKARIRAYKHTEEAKLRISETCKQNGVGLWKKPSPWNKGKTLSPETRAKISQKLKGRKMPSVSKANKNRVYSEATLKKRSEVMKETLKRMWSSEEHRKRMTGENNARWISDRTAYQEKCRIRGTIEWNEWRDAVFTRDKHTCQECGAIGGKLEPHHIIPIRKDWSKIFEITNGITLCRPCHKRTIWKEDDFQEKYLRITNLTITQF